MVDEVRVDVFTRRDEVDGVTAAIMAGAHSALPGAGIVAVVPVEKLFLIRTGAEATREEFWPKQAPEAAA